MKVERTESRIEDVLTTLMPKEVLKESLALKFSFLGDRFFPNSFSYGVFANVGSGALPGRLPGGRFPEVPRQVPNHGFWEGSGQVPGQVPNHVPNHGFQEGSGASSEPRVPGRFRGRFRTTGSEKVPGQVPNHGFQEGSGAGSEPRFPGRFRGRFREGPAAGS